MGDCSQIEQSQEPGPGCDVSYSTSQRLSAVQSDILNRWGRGSCSCSWPHRFCLQLLLLQGTRRTHLLVLSKLLRLMSRVAVCAVCRAHTFTSSTCSQSVAADVAFLFIPRWCNEAKVAFRYGRKGDSKTVNQSCQQLPVVVVLFRLYNSVVYSRQLKIRTAASPNCYFLVPQLQLNKAVRWRQCSASVTLTDTRKWFRLH